jgi:hypothetical protein
LTTSIDSPILSLSSYVVVHVVVVHVCVALVHVVVVDVVVVVVVMVPDSQKKSGLSHYVMATHLEVL